jgi:hypothetical protein
VATGDLTRSGKLDLVTADYSSGEITVFLGAGKGNFASGVAYAAGAHPNSVAVADIKGDGRPDVVVTNESAGTISVLLGNGDGTLQPLQSYTIGFNPFFIATGDFSGNGRVDVAVAGKSGQLAILLNDRNGSLKVPIVYPLSKTPTALAMGDFNSDGHNDLALANADGTVSILLGKGAGLFRALPDTSVASGPLSSLASADLNKDGRIDLVVTQPGRKLVSVLLGKGDGTFAPPASYPVGNDPVSTVVADVDGDGVADLVVINKASNTFSVLGGNGDGTFKSSLDFVAGNAPLAAVAGDFYGDGRADLAIINHASQTVSVPAGNGDRTFKAGRSYEAGVQPVSIASGNLNGDKIPGLVVANYCGSEPTCSAAGSVAVFLADNKGVYRLSATYAVGAGPVSVALADVNGDRNLDIVALNRLDKTATVMLGVGDGTFRQPMTFPLAGAPIAVAVGDLNKDGKLDLAVLEDCGSAKCSQAGSLEILLGGGDGSFQSAASYPVGYSPASIAVGAIHGDKNLDLVVANRCGKDASCQSTGTATVLIGDGTGKFTPGTDIALGNSPSSIALGNLTGSGLDLVVSRSTDNTVAVLHGNGDGTFRAAVPYPVGNNPGSLVVADFNGDGKADVAVANVNDATVSILYGRGDGTLQAASALAVGSSPTALTVIGSTTGGHPSLATADGASSSGVGTEFKVLPHGSGTTPVTVDLAVAPTPNSKVNQAVTLTATFAGSPTPVPTGTVNFYNGSIAPANLIPDCTPAANPVPVDGTGTATCTTSSLTAPSASLVAAYSGDGTYLGEDSNVVAQTVAQLSPSLTFLATTPGTSTPVNQAVTFSAALGAVAFTPTKPTNTVNFTVGTAPATTIGGCGAQALVLTAGAWTASCTTNALALGNSQTIGAVYAGDANFKTATAPTISQSVVPFAATINVGTTPTEVNQPVTITAQLAGTGIAFTPTAPSGTFNFMASGTTISGCGAVPVTATGSGAGGASCPWTPPAGTAATTYPISVTYSGDTNFTTAAAGTATQTFIPFAATINVSSPGAGTVNSPVTLTAQLAGTGIAFTPTAPSGKFNFGVTVAGTTTSIPTCGAMSVNPTTGAASCTTSTLVAPSDAISVTYSGDSNFTTAAPGTMTQNETPVTATLTVTGSPASVAVDALPAATFTAQVGPTPITPVTPSGTVTFKINGKSSSDCPTVTLTPASAGAATCTTSSLVVPADIITATYSGDSNFTGPVTSTATETVTQVAATTTLASSPVSPVVNQPVTLTATIKTPTGSSTEVEPTGSVTFTQGGTTLCSAAVISSTNQTATCNYVFGSAIASPGSTITATYSGDTNFTAGTPGTVAEIVTPAGTTTSVVSLPNPSAVNQQVTLTATVTPNSPAGTTPTSPTGTVTFTNTTSSTTLCTKTLSGGTVPVCTYTFTSPGTYDVVATYTSGDANFTGSASGATADAQVVNSGNTSVSLTSALNPSFVNQAVTFNAAISFSSGTSVPTGTVTYYDGAAALTGCTFTATSGSPFTGGVVPPCTVPLLTQGTHSITAKYSGDSNFSGATSSPISQVVNPTATTTSVVSSPNPSAVNAQVTFTATVTPTYTAGTTQPTGTVTFTNTTSATTLCTKTLSGGTVPPCTYTFTATGTYDVVATYVSGDTNFAGSASGATADVQSVVTSTTKVNLTSLPTSSTVNQAVTFTATVAPGNSGSTAPTGTVTFNYAYPSLTPPVATAILGTCSNVSVSTVASVTTAACTAPLPLDGSATITATYSGDTNFAGGSQTLAQPVGQTSTNTSVTLSPSSLSVNQGVTFTATVASTISGATTPTGTMSFSYSLNGGASVSLCAGAALSTAAGITTAQCAGQALPTAGSYVITAAYSSDANFKASTGTTTTSPITVVASPTTTTLVSSPPSSAVNQSVTFTATVTPTYSGTTKPATVGTVTFTNTTSSTTLCSGIAVVNGANGTTAVCNFTFTTAGTYDIVATYSPSTDTNFTGSASGATADVQKVGAGATSISVISSLPSGSFVNQQVSFSATISFVSSGSTMPTGTVTYYNNGAALPNCVFTATTAAPFTGGSVPACPVAFATAGKYSITAVYSGDTNFSGATSTAISQVVNTTATTTAVVSSPNPSAVNAQVIFTATVTPAYTAGTTPSSPTGTVTFTNTTSSTTLCTKTLSGGTVPVCTYTFTASGTYDVVATYTSGDTNFAGSASGATADVQNVGVQATTVSVTSSLPSPAGSTVNQPVTFSATIKLSTGTTTNPTGIVTYSDGASVLCTFGTKAGPATFTGGVVPACTATLLTATSTTVTHAITASYSGDSNFGASTGNLTQIVNPEATVTTLAALPVSPVPLNTPVTFTATVTPSPNVVSSNSPTGTVTFSYRSTNLCTSVGVTAAAGSATAACTYTLPLAETFPVVATYSADANFSASASSALNFVVGQTPTTLSLTSTLPTAVVSQIVTFAARVVSGNPGAVAPSGTVSFTSTDPSSIASQCGAQPVTPVENAKATGFDGIATCSVQFPITEQFTAPFAVSAVYNPATTPVQDFMTSNSSIQQAVQNYIVAFTAPVSGTPPALAPVFVTQGYSNINDLFNPNTDITVQVTSSGSFEDKLNITCRVTAQVVSTIPAGQAVSDPSCAANSSASTLSGATGSTLSFTVTASPAAPVGSYNVTITATDNSATQTMTNGGAAYSLSETTATPVVVYVEGESNGLTLAQGATGTENPVFNTAGATSGSKLLSFACGKVFTAAGVSVPNPSSAPVVTCTGPTGGVTVGSAGLTTVPIQISLATTVAQLNRSNTASLAALLGIPLLALMGWFGSRKSPRRNFFRFIGLIVLMVGASYAATGCGGSFTQTGGLPSNGGLPVGSYLVQVIAYGGSNQTGNQYYAVVPLTVNANSAK